MVAAILLGATEQSTDGFDKVAAISAMALPGWWTVSPAWDRSAIHRAEGGDKREQGAHIESLRKMLLAMVEDIRVVLIKLAERTQAMRELTRADDATRRRVAREVQDIFAPLANRLGVWQVKWSLKTCRSVFLSPNSTRKSPDYWTKNASVASSTLWMCASNYGRICMTTASLPRCQAVPSTFIAFTRR